MWVFFFSFHQIAWRNPRHSAIIRHRLPDVGGGRKCDSLGSPLFTSLLVIIWFFFSFTSDPFRFLMLLFLPLIFCTVIQVSRQHRAGTLPFNAIFLSSWKWVGNHIKKTSQTSISLSLPLILPWTFSPSLPLYLSSLTLSAISFSRSLTESLSRYNLGPILIFTVRNVCTTLWNATTSMCHRLAPLPPQNYTSELGSVRTTLIESQM